MIVLIFLLPIILAVIVAMIAVFIYNNLVTLKNTAVAAWHQIDVQLARRADLVGNLVETVKGYAAHEKTVLEDVTNARSSVMQSKTPGDAGKAMTGLDGALARLFAVAENYPNLKADTSFLSLQNQLREIELSIAEVRQYYNGVVRNYNIACERFPANLFATTFGFAQRDYFEIPETKTEPPKVSFT